MATQIILDNIQWVNCSISGVESKKLPPTLQLNIQALPETIESDFSQKYSAETVLLPWKTLDVIPGLPIELDSVSKSLLRYWLSPYYWQAAQGLSRRMPPSSPDTCLQQTSHSASNLYVTLPGSDTEQHMLLPEAASSQYQGIGVAAKSHEFAVIQSINNAITGLSPWVRDNDNLLSAIMSLATLEFRLGDREKSLMHFEASRRAMKLMGGPLELENSRTERFAVWYECVHATSMTSFVWDESDIQVRLAELVQFLDSVTREWQCNCSKSTQMVADNTTRLRRVWNAQWNKPVLKSESMLYRLLTRNPSISSPGGNYEVSHSSAQLSCIILYALYHVKACCDQPDSETSRSYLGTLDDTLKAQGLTDQHSILNVAWHMLANSAGLTEAESSKRRWHVAAMMNVVKYMNFTWQTSLMNWLLRYIQGKSFVGPIRIDRFAFSYHAAAFEVPAILETP